MSKHLKDPMSALTHLLGVLLAIPGTILLIYDAVTQGTILHVVSYSIFGLTLISLYTASTVYHSVKAPQYISDILRKIDHMMIFVFIAGSYTPICLVVLKGAWGYTLLSIIWVIALSGIILKIVWMNAPRWLYTAIYIAMGWTLVIAIYPLITAMPRGGIEWLFLGGIIYTIGGIIYATKWPSIKCKWFGFHEIFHLFIIAGSLCHYWLMYRYILQIG